MKTKLKLSELKVKSFVTNLNGNENQTLNGGRPTTKPGEASYGDYCTFQCTAKFQNCFGTDVMVSACCDPSFNANDPKCIVYTKPNK